MKPTKKSEEIETLLTVFTGEDRRKAIRLNVCMGAPIGCGGPAMEFRDELGAIEYSISGLCQNCQDQIFS